jgi:phosphinothricin acetyltransferase
MHLCDASETDLAAIVAIYNAAIPSRIVTADTESISVESRIDWFHRHHPDQYPLWVVKSDGELAGWLGFQPFYGRPAYRMTAEISIYIAPSHQRQGIGRYLLATAIDRSPALGIKTLLGFIFAANQPSLRLFEQFQFQQWGYLPAIAELDKVEQDLVIVGLRTPSVAPIS